MTGTGTRTLSFVFISPSLHCGDAGREAALVPRGLVAVDDLLAHQRVDDRYGLDVARSGRLRVTPGDGRVHVAHRRAHARAQRYIAGAVLLSLPGGFLGGLGVGHNSPYRGPGCKRGR